MKTTPIQLESCFQKLEKKSHQSSDWSQVFSLLNGTYPLKTFLLQAPPAPPAPPAQPAPPESSAPTGEARAYIAIFIEDWLFQISRAASGTEAESICLFKTS